MEEAVTIVPAQKYVNVSMGLMAKIVKMTLMIARVLWAVELVVLVWMKSVVLVVSAAPALAV